MIDAGHRSRHRRARRASSGTGATRRGRADIEIAAGDVVAVLGPNGSGKSTLVKGMLGLVDVLGGTVRMFGRPLHGGRSIDDRLRAAAAERGRTDPGDGRRTGPLGSPRIERMVAARRAVADRRAVAAAIDVVGLTGQRGRPVSRLSGGQQRRALVARGLAGGAGAAPRRAARRRRPANQAALADALRVLAEAGTTIVVVLHELGPLQPLVTRVVA